MLLVLVGLVLSGWLFHRHLALLRADGEVDPSVCSTVLHLDCDAALRHERASWLGIPLAGWGLVGYGTMAALLVLGAAVGDAFRRPAWRAVLVLALLATAGGLWLTGWMVTGETPFCPLCAAAHATSLALATSLLIDRVRRRVPDPPPAAGATTLGFAAAALAALVLFQGVALRELQSRPDEPDVKDALAAYALQRRVEVPILEHDPVQGPEDAPATLVVFTDFECPACRRFARRLAGWKGGVRVVFKQFPAGADCNPMLEHDLHPRACAAARAAEAAAMQGRFWEYHDALFAAENLGEDALRGLAVDLGLDVDRFDADRTGDEAARRVGEDVELGIALGLDATPAVFLDGRRVPDLTPPALQLLLMSARAPKHPASDTRSAR